MREPSGDTVAGLQVEIFNGEVGTFNGVTAWSESENHEKFLPSLRRRRLPSGDQSCTIPSLLVAS
jgi:hypothetical protein